MVGMHAELGSWEHPSRCSPLLCPTGRPSWWGGGHRATRLPATHPRARGTSRGCKAREPSVLAPLKAAFCYAAELSGNVFLTPCAGLRGRAARQGSPAHPAALPLLGSQCPAPSGLLPCPEPGRSMPIKLRTSFRTSLGVLQHAGASVMAAAVCGEAGGEDPALLPWYSCD